MNASMQRLRDRLRALTPRIRRKGYSNPRRFRLILVNDRTFNAVWTVHLTMARLCGVVALLVFALMCLIYIVLAFTPAKAILPGYLKKSERREYVAESQRIDSLAREATVQKLYMDNIVAILNDDVDTDSLRMVVNSGTAQSDPDSLADATEREQEFVRAYRQRERFNLSVLAPIAAEGMTFLAPADMGLIPEEGKDAIPLTFRSERATGVSTIYRGTVVATYFTPVEGYTVVVQHPNDFLSTYRGLGEVFVGMGDKVSTGQRIGLFGTEAALQRPMLFDLWHSGQRLAAAPYLQR